MSLSGKQWAISIGHYQRTRDEIDRINVKIEDSFTCDEIEDLIRELRKWVRQQREGLIAQGMLP